MGFSELSFYRKLFVYAIVLVLICSLLLIIVCLVNTLTITPENYNYVLNESCSFVTIDRNFTEAVERFSESLTFATVSYADDSSVNTSAFLEYHSFFNRSYPGIFRSNLTTVETINKFSLLITIQGSLLNLPPYVLMSHLDVVPANASKWNCDPFSGQIDNEWVCGRGALDTKLTTIAILEALNSYLEQGYLPTSSILLVFGHDEETGGKYGALEISKLMTKRNIRPRFILNEGAGVMEQIFPGLSSPVAALGIAEKGYLTLKMKATGHQGHSSIPPFDSGIEKLAKAITKLSPSPQKVWFGYGPENALLKNVAPYLTFGYRFIFANQWLFAPLMRHVFLSREKIRALVQTTTAFTYIEGGFKENGAPGEATATINHRVHPLDSLEDVLASDRLAVADESITFNILNWHEGSPETPYDHTGWAYHMIAATVRETSGSDVINAPTLLVAGTDSKHFVNLTKHNIRFTPAVLDSKSIASVHGINERVSIKNFVRAVKFYENLIRIADCQAHSGEE